LALFRNKEIQSPIRPHLKWVVLFVAVVISAGSILYTNYLVNQLRNREKRQIEIYARSLEFLANESINASFVLDEIVSANNTIPVILADDQENPEFYKNLSHADKITDEKKRSAFLKNEIIKMKDQYDPILVTLSDHEGKIYGEKYIYYKNSRILNELQYYPYVQLSIIGIFGVLSFLTLNYLRSTEQNQVWVGMAKETAHQLGTPLSSLMAWSEYFKDTFKDQHEVMVEFDKDIERLKIITDRFSSIGSEPQLTYLNVVDTITSIINYLETRLSTKINISISSFPSDDIHTHLNESLFAWVIENLCKNAADAMEGKGLIAIQILKANDGKIAIDIIDSGKGIQRSNINDVFRAGFTTKKRGWGLGLALVKRIIEEYHGGKIFVKSSEVNKGTTFRIYLNQ